MKRQIIRAAALAGMMLAPGLAFGAGFQNAAQSATSTGMGGIGVANPDEPNHTFYNPALMTEREKLSVYVGPTLIMPTVTWTGPDGQQDQTQSLIAPPPNFNLTVPFGDFAAGLGVTLPYGLTIAWDDDWEGRELIQRQALTTINVNPNFAMKFPGLNLSVGAGVQAVFSALELERAVVLRHDTEVQTHLGGTGYGVGGNAGILYRPLPELSLGLNYRSAVKLNFDGRAHFDGAQGTPFEQGFVDQDISTDITLPHAISVGIGYQIHKLFVGFDAIYTTWSTYDQVEVTFTRECQPGSPTCDPAVDETDPGTTVIRSDWVGSPTFRFGAQYEVMENLPIRAGFAYDMTPVPDDTVGPSLPDNNRTIIAVGTGYTIYGVRADIGYQLVMATRVIDNGNNDGEYRTSAHVIGINAGYGF